VKKNRDAYGAELIASYKGGGIAPYEIVERDDSFISISTWLPRYFSDYPEWSKSEQQAASLMKGRVLDVGSGAARYALYLQKKGHDVTAIDNSPGAIQVCKWRGVRKALVRSIMEVGKFKPGSFDTVIMMGNNFGLFGGQKRARRLLKDFYRITSSDGQIIAEAMDPYQTKAPAHLGYHKLNQSRGRMPGQLRIRVRHDKIVGPWFDYLFVSQQEMKEIISGTGWHIAKIISDKGPGYTAVLKKDKR
jgi:SAM-dependent methyltransferase